MDRYKGRLGHDGASMGGAIALQSERKTENSNYGLICKYSYEILRLFRLSDRAVLRFRPNSGRGGTDGPDDTGCFGGP
ncbi:hypothetical protein GCM10009069_24450 [Algimonas arctica]|uniref:Uncharacterized protein n=1 Tax=Algimonas arctica TaxID=1479486 RepID=A0A8J3CSL2_9PROT|nr:hypothetical protein GCM10009069_24450 [Algimonas arctica]